MNIFDIHCHTYAKIYKSSAYEYILYKKKKYIKNAFNKSTRYSATSPVPHLLLYVNLFIF